jgi:hypothetical protein
MHPLRVIWRSGALMFWLAVNNFLDKDIFTHYIIPELNAYTMTAMGEFGRPRPRLHMLIVWQTVAMSAT